jgi:tetratricopeptide (TPR) repeat protein
MKQKLQQALQLLNSGQTKQALQIVTQLEQEFPQEASVLETLGYCLLAMGNANDALIPLLKAHTLLPQSAQICAYIGGIYHGQQEMQNAQVYFRKTVALDPDYARAWHFLSLIQFHNEEFEEGIKSQAQAKRCDPFAVHLQQVASLLDKGESQKAIHLCRQILQQHGSHPVALLYMATQAAQQGQLENARDALRQALSYSPYNYNVLNLYTQVCAQLRHYQEALPASQKLTLLQPDSEQSWFVHADNLLNAGKFTDALNAFNQAAKLNNGSAETLLQQAHVHKILDNSELAVETYEKCTPSTTTMGAAFWGLVNMRNYVMSDQQIAQIENMQLDPNIPLEQACQAGFALATWHEKQQRYPEAFAAYKNANMNHTAGLFSPKQYADKCASIKNTFSADILATRAKSEPHAATPIFIVGLPRSGSTLIEQMLASHTLIEGTMELKILPAIARKVYLESCVKNKNKSGSMQNFTEVELAQYGQQYLQMCNVYRNNKAFFIDKLPPNFQHIGLIKMILPQAVIIDARRQPLSCGMGIYKQYFGHGHDFSYNLEHIAVYYNEYLALMDYWTQVFPKQILTVQHEVLVETPEQQLKQILEFCGVAYEPKCLEFHSNNRAVRTASSEQVRQPINPTGMQLWKHYEQELQPLKEALGEQTLGRFNQWIDV